MSPARKAWELLNVQERRNAVKVLAAMGISALGSAAMVGSVFPFLSVLSNPDLIHKVPALEWIYSSAGFTSDYNFLVALGLGAIFVILISNVLLVMSTWAVARYTQMRVHSISRRLLGHYLAQPYDFFFSRHSGEMSTKVLAESQQVVTQFIRPLAELISSLLTVAAVVTMLIIVEPVVATLTIGIFAAIYATITVFTRRHVRTLGQRRAHANEARFRVAGEALSGIKDVKLLGREAAYLNRYSGPSTDMARSEIGVAVFSQAPRYAIQIVAFGGIIVLSLVMLDPSGLQEREALGGILPLVGLLAFAGQRLMPELQKLYSSITQMTAGAAALDRVHHDLHTGMMGSLVGHATSAPLGLRQALELDGVSYTYPNAERPGLLKVSLCIGAGERIGIIGASGAGKTTLVDVVLGLLEPKEGNLRVDGTRVTGENLRAWQKTVGYVPQEIFLADASLAENIALGLRPEEIDAAKVENAARIAQLHDFVVSELSEGYSTFIGERGVRLSGGQRQRIGIARALYQDADLIVFDEATSALDNLTEREVMSAIETLPGNKTILMIAHRLSTVKMCDRIVVMQRGEVAGIGPWSVLADENVAFQRISDPV